MNVDKGIAIGVVVALVGILLGLHLDGGNVGQILQPTAALIVFGGTFGAVMVQFPLDSVFASCKRLVDVFLHPTPDPASVVAEMITYANKARKEGVVSLDSELERIQEPFLKRALMLAVDGTEPQELRNMMELELDSRLEREERAAQVFEAAGGFAPTIGIIGAILGLIQVMQHLNQINEVGRGIAVAFVATIYGVASANLVFLPLAGKVKIRVREEQAIREMMLEGVVSILEGINPRMLQTKLQGFLGTRPQSSASGESAS